MSCGKCGSNKNIGKISCIYGEKLIDVLYVILKNDCKSAFDNNFIRDFSNNEILTENYKVEKDIKIVIGGTDFYEIKVM